VLTFLEMVRVIRRRLQAGFIGLGLAASGVLSAQVTIANSPAILQENVAKRTEEWTTLASNLELRLSRLLPCDARVRASIEEVSRAADARAVARTSYWTTISVRSRAQIEAIRGLLAQEEARSGDWAKDRADAVVDVAAAAAEASSLGPSIRQLPALTAPQKSLEAIAQTYRVLQTQSEERETGFMQLIVDLRELLKASQARQAAIEDQLKSIGSEGQLWSAYYIARQARAQIECSMISPDTAAPPRPLPPKPRRTP
jgi:hypothetical protein